MSISGYGFKQKLKQTKRTGQKFSKALLSGGLTEFNINSLLFKRDLRTPLPPYSTAVENRELGRLSSKGLGDRCSSSVNVISLHIFGPYMAMPGIKPRLTRS